MDTESKLAKRLWTLEAELGEAKGEATADPNDRRSTRGEGEIGVLVDPSSIWILRFWALIRSLRRTKGAVRPKNPQNVKMKNRNFTSEARAPGRLMGVKG